MHYELWDGAGYPQQLYGGEITYTGRIVTNSDVFDAMIHERPYKEAWPVSKALNEMAKQSGNQFDPKLVDTLLYLDL